jgi:hypothetical protein
MKHNPSIEALEARIAPAAVLTLTDFDGDIVTITTSKGTSAQLDAVVFRGPVGNVGGVQISTIDFSKNSVFDGTDLSITAKRGAKGGDGLVNIGRIDAADDFADVLDASLNLGTVSIDGNLSDFDAGKGTAESRVKSLQVHSASGSTVWNVNADVAALVVKTDVHGVQINLGNGHDIGMLNVGGSIIGEGATYSGSVRVSGEIGLLKIGRDLQGGSGGFSGSISAGRIGSLALGGSILAGSESGSGKIEADTLGSVKIRGDLRGLLYGVSAIESVSIKGDIAAGNEGSGGVLACGSAGLEAKLGRVVVGGSVLGDTGFGGRIAVSGSVASIVIGGDIVGGATPESGAIKANGKIGSLKVGGSVHGSSGAYSGSIGAAGIDVLTIGGDLRGGIGFGSGSILSANILSAADLSTLGVVTIKGSIVGISADKPLVIAAAGPNSDGASPEIAIGKLTVGGRVEFAKILAGHHFSTPVNGDAQIGKVKVAGNWISSSLFAGVDDGGDNLFGTPDDTASPMGNQAGLFSKIASITIGGQVRGPGASGDHYGFVAQEIGSLSVAGTKFPLKSGRSNDNIGGVDPQFQVGATADVTVREIA